MDTTEQQQKFEKFTVLVAEYSENIREVLVLFLETVFQAKVFVTNEVGASIAIVKNNPEVSLVISDYQLIDGNGGQILRFLKESSLNIPFVLCSREDPKNLLEFQSQVPDEYIQKPVVKTDFITKIQGFAKNYQVPLASQEGPEYFPIRIDNFVKTDILPCDIFLKLSENKFLKLANSGMIFDRSDYEHYFLKKIEFFYCRGSDVHLFLNKFSRDILALAHVKSLSQSSILEISTSGHKLLHETSVQFGFTPEMQELAQSCTNMAIRLLSSEKSIKPWLEKLELNRNSYLSDHSILLAQISCLLSSLLNWKSESTQYKLALAALLHDLTLENDEVASMEISIQSYALEKEFESHPLSASQLPQKMSNFPEHVDSIILSHHERPNGLGFPSHKKVTDLDPLSSIFIFAHDLTNYLWIHDKKSNITEFLELYSTEYASGAFKQLAQILGGQTKN